MSTFLGAHNIVSPIGFNSLENFKGLLDGKTALRKQTFDFSDTLFCCAKIEEAVLDKAFSRIGNHVAYTRLEKMCILSIHDVMSQSGIDFENKRNLLILSTTKGNIDLLENRRQTISWERAYLHQFAKVIGHFFKAKNTPLVVSNACISGLLAMIIAKRLIEHKNYDNIVVCGGDIVSEFTLSGFRSFNALSAEPCKPFDAQRTGINLGEAAASILVSRDKISSTVISSGASANDAGHISAPSRTGDGLYQAIEQAFKMSGKNSVDFISAHGTATAYNDDMESTAFSRAKISSLQTNSLKGYYGHTLGAAGTLESIISIQSLAENTLIRSAGFELMGTSEPVNVIKRTEQRNLRSVLKTASGFGGCNAAAIFEKKELG